MSFVGPVYAGGGAIPTGVPTLPFGPLRTIACATLAKPISAAAVTATRANVRFIDRMGCSLFVRRVPRTNNEMHLGWRAVREYRYPVVLGTRTSATDPTMVGRSRFRRSAIAPDK